MNTDRKVIVGLGEILWDLLPQGKLMGGAPANFAFHAAQLGDIGIPASRVGRDELGDEILARLRALGLTTEYLQVDEARPTGTVNVELNEDGQPRFTIVEGVAWDHLEWTPEWEALAARADAVCFGSLAQRHVDSRETILQFLGNCREEALRIFDINLRGNYFDVETISRGLASADIVKMNDEELARIAEMLGLATRDDAGAARELINRFGLDMVCVTFGGRGSVLVTSEESASHPGFAAKVADTIGSGDAYMAAVAHHHLRGAPLDRIVEAANRLGAFVAEQSGGTPGISASVLGEVTGLPGK